MQIISLPDTTLYRITQRRGAIDPFVQEEAEWRSVGYLYPLFFNEKTVEWHQKHFGQYYVYRYKIRLRRAVRLTNIEEPSYGALKELFRCTDDDMVKVVEDTVDGWYGCDHQLKSLRIPERRNAMRLENGGLVKYPAFERMLGEADIDGIIYADEGVVDSVYVLDRTCVRYLGEGLADDVAATDPRSGPLF